MITALRPRGSASSWHCARTVRRTASVGLVQRWAGVGTMVGIVVMAWPLYGQAPGTSSLETQVASLSKQVAALEQKIAALEQQGSRVKAPFEVVDASGKPIVRIFAAGREGQLVVMGADGQIGAALAGGGNVGVFRGGTAVAGMKTEADGRGALLIGAGGRRAVVITTTGTGDGLITVAGSDGQLGAAIGGNGNVSVYHAEQPVAGIKAETDGRGACSSALAGNASRRCRLTRTIPVPVRCPSPTPAARRCSVSPSEPAPAMLASPSALEKATTPSPSPVLPEQHSPPSAKRETAPAR